MRKVYKASSMILALIFVSLFIGNNYGQVSGYTFSQQSGTYTPITGGTVLGTATNDDTGFNNQPIGFTFVYNGVSYTAFSVQSNGFISMGTTIASSYTAISTGSTNNIIAGLNGDLQGTATTGELSYLTSGTAPYRTLTVQWKNYRHFGATGDNYNFQIVLYETTNVVEVVYGSFTQNATNRTRQVGLRGASSADYNNRTTTTNWSATTAGAVNSANCSLTAAIKPTSGLIFDWGAEIVPPITQDPTPPSCATGSPLSIVGVPAANTTWYWQTTANGTSTANSAATPWTVFSNGTYYARAYNSLYQTWSPVSTSIVVSNFPVAPAPPAPVAAVDPSCAPTGTTISVPSAPAGFEYYWQGTTSGGTSNTLNASSTYPVTTTGTYYVTTYETATQCWSGTVGTLVTVSTVIPPAPIVNTPTFNYCAGVLTAPITADVPVQMVSATCSASATASGTDNTNVTATVNNFSCATGTITGATMNATIGTQCTAWYYYSIVVNGVTVATQQCNQTGFNLTPYLPLTSVQIVSFDNPADGIGDFVNMNLTVNLSYTAPAVPQPTYVLNWFDASTAGSMLGTGSPFETVGTSVMPTAVNGSYPFYVESKLGGCSSATRELVTVNITDVNAQLTPVNVTCNGGNNGSFTLGTVDCGTAPFLYSVNGGAFGAIPTNLIAGTYSVVMQDAGMLLSAPITVVVTQPAPPANLTVVNTNYFSVDVSWTTTGNETQWNVEYGPAGFTLGTGTVILANATSATITGLTEDTDYEFYVTAVCGSNAVAAGPEAFSTNAGFFTYDNACGPGFMDISSTGTQVVGLTDDSEAGLTLPWSWDVNGTTVTSITIGNNGGILFNTTTGNVGYTATGNGMFPFAQDLNTAIAGGGVYYQNIGTSPNQQFVIMWEGLPHWPSTSGDATFEIIYDEASGEVYFLYNDVIMDNASYNYGADAEIAINTAAGNVSVSVNNATYLTNNSCIHFYNALCPNPVLSSVLPFQEEVMIDWNAGLYGEVDWTLIYGPAGFDPTTSGTTITTTTSDANILGLTQLTNYDVYIYSECMIDNLTSPGLLVSFQTLPWCSNPTGVVTATAVDSLFTSWNWVATDVAYPSTGFNIQYGPTGFDLYTGTIVNADNNLTDTTANAAFLAGGVYQVYVQGVCGADTSSYSGPFTFIMPLSNDSVCGAEMLMADGTVYTFNNAGATVEVNENTIAPPATGAQTTTGWINSTLNNTTWFTFVAPATGNVRVNNTAINYAGQSAVYNSMDCSDFANFTLEAANDNAIGGTSVAPNYTICGLTPGTTYYLLNDGSTATTGNYSISITPIVLEAGFFADVINVCTGDTVNLFDGITGNDNGGVWTAELASAGTGLTDSLFASNGLAYQVFNFEYRMTDGCAYDSIIAQVEIFAPSSAGIDGTVTVCRNEPVDLLSGLSGNVDMGGQWYDPSNNPIASSEIISSNIPGQFNYDYITGNGVCPDDTANVLIDVDGSCNYLDIQEMYFGSMTLLPNPTTGLVYISNQESTEVFNYEITDVDGRIIATKTNAINGSVTTEIDLKGKVTGMYLIRVYNDNAEKVFRVILQ